MGAPFLTCTGRWEKNEMKNIAIPVSIVLGAVGCHPSKPIEQPPQAVRAERMEAQPRMTAGGLRFSAVVMPDVQVPLSFRITGYVASLKEVRGEDGKMRDIAEGDRVSRGAVLVRIRSAEYEDKVRQASSQAAAAEAVALRARLDFDRAKRLYDSQSITKPDFDAARAQFDAAQEELKSARAATSEAEIALRDTSLVAPFDGDIVRKAVELGAFVGPGLPAFVLAKTDVVKITIGVPDTTVRSIQLGQPIEVTVDAFAHRTFHARISRIASAADPKTRNFEVEVAIPNPDRLLKVGMIGSLQLATGEMDRQERSFQVPLSAIVQSPNGNYGVFVVATSDGGESARMRAVEIGNVVGSEITVVRGLAAGDEVITTGANLLKDGQRVEVLK